MNIKKYIDAIPTDYLKCRLLGHAWEAEQISVSRHNNKRVYAVKWYCLRCSSVRDESVNIRMGDVAGRHYRYPAGYIVSGAGKEISRSQLRNMTRVPLIERLVSETGR